MTIRISYDTQIVFDTFKLGGDPSSNVGLFDSRLNMLHTCIDSNS